METRQHLPTLPAPSETEAHSAEIAGEVRDTAISLFAGRLSPVLFQRALVTLESAKVARFGFRLRAERLPCGTSRVDLLEKATGRTRATYHFATSFEDPVYHRPHG